MTLRRTRRQRQTRSTTPGIDHQEAAVVVPAVLPQILLEAVSADTLVVTVNGDRLAATPIRRDEIATTVTGLVARLGSPTRVEVRELDGSVHADILTPPTPQPDSLFAPPETASSGVVVPQLWECTGDGFVPGEDVAVALILRHTTADLTGTARALVDRDEQPAITGEVILLGRISGTTSVHPID
ncbi:hypothetical protein FM104_16010 [Microbacterium esteraromaticum]|uniref:Uncharacterized protein n=1 Tax=Microbacterium esteraromaticum TaxID=57043 RepID=A0A1R4KSW0_9MICO|nr:hypothetical protein [Microbacterium esteraromaticum]SJN47352.1 hypothetical protein FM104_16010 [Microbacterium esteraromaticum]